MAKHSVIITIDKGSIQNKATVRTLFDALPDGKYMLELSAGSRRTSPQNRYYHGLVVPMIQNGLKDLGNEFTLEEVHEFLKARFNFQEVISKGGLHECVPKSTTKLTTTEFIDYIEKIQRFAAEFLNLVIPDPGSALHLEFHD